jgi:hypothetical protein
MTDPMPPAGRQFRWFNITKHQYLWDVAAVATDGTAWAATAEHGDLTSLRWRQVAPLPGGA